MLLELLQTEPSPFPGKTDQASWPQGSPLWQGPQPLQIPGTSDHLGSSGLWFSLPLSKQPQTNGGVGGRTPGHSDLTGR